MDSSIPTEELQLAGGPEPAAAGTELHSLVSGAVRQRCAACGAAMAADQRYCVECGERRGAARVSLLEGPARPAQASPPASAPAQRRIAPVNSTLISVIGILLLAMGIGVLIGRSGNSTTLKSPPAQVVTVASAPSTGAATTTPATSTATSATSTSASSSTAAKAKSKAAAKLTLPKSKVPLPKAVKVGTTGHGRGYQKGKFTGNFFGSE
jgi:hypothetical protein